MTHALRIADANVTAASRAERALFQAWQRAVEKRRQAEEERARVVGEQEKQP